MLAIKLSGRIDANNAAKVEEEISQRLAEFPGEVPEFDASELEYISSAGLRVLLKFRKQFGKNIDVLNVSSAVYDIFEVTGFTELLNVRKRLREISLDGLEVIGGGAFSTVYRLDSETILKVCDKPSFTGKAVTFADVENDRHASREIFVHDIPTAISYDVVKCGEYYGLVYEMIDADTMSGTLKKHPERLEELSIKAAHLLKKLHAAEFAPGTFPDSRDKIRPKLHAVYKCGAVTADDMAVLDGIIDRIPYRNTLLHGDFHPKNLMVSGDDLILIDVGDAGLGNPIIDFILIYAHHVIMPGISEASGTRFHEKLLGLNAETLGSVWKILMREYFGTSDSETLSRYEGVIQDYASIFTLSFAALSGLMPTEESAEIICEKMRRFREIADTLTPIAGI